MLSKTKSKSRKDVKTKLLIDDYNKELLEVILSKYQNNYYQKHLPLNTSNEYIFLNSKAINNCPYCSSNKIIKSGKNKNNVQQYFCKNCKHYFNPTTGTLFENHKIEISELIDFLLNIFRFQSVESASRNNKNSWATGRYWLEKVFYVLKNSQEEIKLSKKVYISNLYILDVKSEYIFDNQYKFNSQNKHKICIGLATDKEHTIVKFLKIGNATDNCIFSNFQEHIIPCSKLIHLRSNCYKSLSNKLSLIDISFDKKLTANLSKNKNPLEPINSRIRSLKYFLSVHNGIKYKNLQDYLNLYSFIINPPYDMLSKVCKIFTLMLSAQKVIKYRDFSNKC